MGGPVVLTTIRDVHWFRTNAGQKGCEFSRARRRIEQVQQIGEGRADEQAKRLRRSILPTLTVLMFSLVVSYGAQATPEAGKL
jgi:hypothetical protein